MLAVGTSEGRVYMFDAATGRVRWEVQSYTHTESNDHTMAMTPDGKFVASVGGSDENWKLRDAERGVLCMTGSRHDGTGGCTCRANRSGLRKALDAGCPVQAHTAGLRALSFSPCGERLATGGDDRAVILWNAQTGRAEQVLGGHTERVRSVCFSADGARLASGSWDGFIRVWDAKTGAMLRAILHGSPVGWVHFSPTDSRRLASVGYDGTLKQWDVDSGERRSRAEGSTFSVFSPDGRMIATRGVPDGDSPSRHDVHLLEAETGAVAFRLVGEDQCRPTSAAWSLDGRKVASGSSDGTCRVWDASTGALLRTIEPSAIGGWVCSLTWGRDWVLDMQRAVAFAMGHHPRLGAGSRVLALDAGVVRMVLDRV